MDLRRANTPEPLNMTWAGERSKYFCSFQSPELFFLLTLPFIERAYRHELPDCRYSETNLSLVYPDRDHSAGNTDRPA